MEHAWNMYGIGMEYVSDMSGILTEDVWNMHEYVGNMHGICIGYAWNMYGI